MELVGVVGIKQGVSPTTGDVRGDAFLVSGPWRKVKNLVVQELGGNLRSTQIQKKLLMRYGIKGMLKSACPQTGWMKPIPDPGRTLACMELCLLSATVLTSCG